MVVVPPDMYINKTSNYTIANYPGQQLLYASPGQIVYFFIWFNNSGGTAATVWINDTLPRDVNPFFGGSLNTNATANPYYTGNTTWYDAANDRWHVNFTFSSVPKDEGGWWFWMQS